MNLNQELSSKNNILSCPKRLINVLIIPLYENIWLKIPPRMTQERKNGKKYAV